MGVDTVAADVHASVIVVFVVDVVVVTAMVIAVVDVDAIVAVVVGDLLVFVGP